MHAKGPMREQKLSQQTKSNISKSEELAQKRSKIGRDGVEASGQNWAESPKVAHKGRYADGNRLQGDHPDQMIDTDVSEAV